MRVLFAHDHHFIRLDGDVYSESQFSAPSWQRYLRVFDTLTVFAREGRLPPGKQKADLVLSSGPNISFALGPNLSSPMAQLRRRAEARNYLRQYLAEVDAVVARLPSELGLLAISEAERSGLPWAVEVVTCAWDALWNYGTVQGKLYAPVMAARMRGTVGNAPFALYVTKEFLQRRYPNVTGNTVACSNVEIPVPSSVVLDQRLSRIAREPRPLVLGLIGTLRTRFKGIQTVLAALARIRHVLPPTEFRVLGSGDSSKWKDEAAAFGVADIVRFDGTLPSGDAVLNWLDNIDVYLQPSFQEGLPRALIEAMSRGCPAIASTCAGIPELLERDNLIRPGDVKHLAELLLRSAADREWREVQARRNWSMAGEYAKDKLEVRRQRFFERFADYAAKRRSAR